MVKQANDFMQSAIIALDDIPMRTAVNRATGNVNRDRDARMAEVTDAEALRQQARASRLRGLHDLPELLEQVEERVTASGGIVLWAQDADEANRHVLNICRRHEARHGVKAKSMLTEEMSLVPVLEAHGIRMVETDLGEYIVQVTGDHPSHITMPVMHRTREAIRDLLMEHADMPYVESAEEMTAFARVKLRQEYLQADIGITGGNFIVAETGHVVTVTNEGNARLTTSVPPVHVALVGIEKVIPTWEDLLTLLQLLTRSGTGQRITVYVNAIRAAGQPSGDDDGAQHFYLILVDNGRSAIYATEYAEALSCIRCGACLNICPVYQSVGGHAYGSVYPGPIGAVITPLLKGKQNAHPLPFASSLCGACKVVCPVDINIPDMLLALRRDLEDVQPPVWKAAMKGFGVGFGHPLLYNAGGKLAATVAELAGDHTPQALPYPFNGWTDQRDFPPLATRRFRDWWQQERESGEE